MKQTTKMSRAVSQLEHMYNALNTDKFDGSLPVPVITVQSKPGTWGHCSRARVWQRKDENTYEMNIAAEMLAAPIEEIIDTKTQCVWSRTILGRTSRLTRTGIT